MRQRGFPPPSDFDCRPVCVRRLSSAVLGRRVLLEIARVGSIVNSAAEEIRIYGPNFSELLGVPLLAPERVVILQAILFLFRQPKRAIEIILPLPLLQDALRFEPLKVRQIAEIANPNISRNFRVVT
jgi:hypothetical protein